jgi:hypothetical protein
VPGSYVPVHLNPQGNKEYSSSRLAPTEILVEHAQPRRDAPKISALIRVCREEKRTTLVDWDGEFLDTVKMEKTLP